MTTSPPPAIFHLRRIGHSGGGVGSGGGAPAAASGSTPAADDVAAALLQLRQECGWDEDLVPGWLADAAVGKRALFLIVIATGAGAPTRELQVDGAGAGVVVAGDATKAPLFVPGVDGEVV
ncbi:hypothetical protein HK405_010239, partial [Cladochytrium tenue]